MRIDEDGEVIVYEWPTHYLRDDNATGCRDEEDGQAYSLFRKQPYGREGVYAGSLKWAIIEAEAEYIDDPSDCKCGRGVRGNENIVNGEVLCDYCCADRLRGVETTIVHNVLVTEDFTLTLDSKMLLEAETYPISVAGECFALTTTPEDALDVALRIAYAVWTVHPELAESFAQRLARDLPKAFNESRR